MTLKTYINGVFSFFCIIIVSIIYSEIIWSMFWSSCVIFTKIDFSCSLIADCSGVLFKSEVSSLPLWLSPVQAVILPISDEFDNYAKKVFEQFNKAGIFTLVDLKNHKINFKIREHSLSKVPLLLICGSKEADKNSITIRKLGTDKQQTLKMDKAIQKISKENQSPIN